MAKKEVKSARTTIEEVNEQLSTVAGRLEQNKKYIYWALAAVAAVVLVVGAYIYGVRNPGIEKAKDLIGKADIEAMQGKTDDALKNYELVLDQYGNKPAERAAVNAAIILYQQGKYEEAAKYLEKYTPEGNMVGPASQSLLGDCYVNLKQNDKALAAFDKAIRLAGGNEFYAPTFMLKKATVLHAMGKYDDEASIYQTIKDQYPDYARIYRINPDKYIERAKAMKGE